MSRRLLSGFRPEWKLTLLTLMLVPVLVRLGVWQLEREEEKLALQQAYETRQAAQPVALDSVDGEDALLYRQVAMQGRFDNARSFLLDNRIYRGRVGYDVIAPFTTAGGTTVLVNRGWISQGDTRADLPAIAPVPGRVRIDGSVYVPVGEQVMLGEESAFSGWPRVIQALDPPARFRELGLDEHARTFPHSVRLAENQPGVLVRNWPVVSTSPEKHRGYAMQWFAMAVVLLGFYIYASTQPRETPRRQNKV